MPVLILVFRDILFALSQKNVIYFVESPLNMMKNAFYFILKAVFVLKIFTFLAIYEKRLD